MSAEYANTRMMLKDVLIIEKMIPTTTCELGLVAKGISEGRVSGRLVGGGSE